MVGKLIAHVRQQWMGAVALFLVLCGGTAWALQANSVGSKHIKNGQVKLADTSDKLRLKCRKGTRYHEGACIERKSRPLASWSVALDACNDLNRRLPDVAELMTFRREPGVELDSAGEWTSDRSFFGNPDFASTVGENQTGGANVGTISAPYRCVTSPRR